MKFILFLIAPWVIFIPAYWRWQPGQKPRPEPEPRSPGFGLAVAGIIMLVVLGMVASGPAPETGPMPRPKISQVGP